MGREAVWEVGPRGQRKGWETMCVSPPWPPGRGLGREGGWSEAEEEAGARGQDQVAKDFGFTSAAGSCTSRPGPGLGAGGQLGMRFSVPPA